MSPIRDTLADLLAQGTLVGMMRGGTSKAGYFLAHDLPAGLVERDALLSSMGSPDRRHGRSEAIPASTGLRSWPITSSECFARVNAVPRKWRRWRRHFPISAFPTTWLEPPFNVKGGSDKQTWRHQRILKERGQERLPKCSCDTCVAEVTEALFLNQGPYRCAS